jgi:uncharacterized membrane protein YjjP (DUF1212 family)
MQQYRNYRWAGRLTGFLGLIFFISFLLGEGFPVLKQAKASYDLLFILTMLSLSLVSYITGWFIEIVAGILLSLIGVIFGVYTSFSIVFEKSSTLFIFTLPFLIPGILFIYAWIVKVKRKKNTNQ